MITDGSKWLAFVIGSLMLVGCDSAAEIASKNASTAQALYEAGDYENAVIAIQKANLARDDVAQQYLLQGRIELARKQLPNAFQAYSHALELDATNAEALQAVSELGLRTGKIREAESAADRILVLEPSATSALLVKGLIALAEKRTDDARGIADQILAASATNEGGIILKARTIAMEGDLNAAMSFLDNQATQTGQTDSIVATKLEVYRAQGDFLNLVEMFKLLVARTPANYDLKIDFANTLYKSGNVSPARSIIGDLIKTQPNNREILKKIAKLWEEYDPAPFDSNQLKAFAASGTPAVREVVARQLLDTGNVASAQTVLGNIAQDEGSTTQGLEARILAALGHTDLAESKIASLLGEDQGNADALQLRAELALKKANTESAINDTQIILRDDPQSEAGTILLAQAFATKREMVRARQVYEEGLKKAPQGFRILTRYVEFLYSLNDTSRAMSVARQFTIANPASIRGAKLYAFTCAKAADRNCAIGAQTAIAKARRTYAIDDLPGTIKTPGLFGRL